ncbi:hypothetical protein amyaer_3963 [Microcystis aeruginosa NIES-2481]|nr:hypothetical protein amyaer_3963 [Microcystis aeruginosa NIES-2481]
MNPSPSKSMVIPTIFFIDGWCLVARLIFSVRKETKNRKRKGLEANYSHRSHRGEVFFLFSLTFFGVN